MQTSESVKTRSAGSWIERVMVGDALSKDTVSTFTGISVLIGVWAVCSFVGAMFMIGGPTQLVRSWFSAVMGF
jgi:hypothetical protein